MKRIHLTIGAQGLAHTLRVGWPLFVLAAMVVVQVGGGRMKKQVKLSSRMNWVLIVRDADGKKVSSQASQGDLDYTKRLGYSALRVDQTLIRIGLLPSYASVEVYALCDVPWQELQPVATLTLDDEEVEQ
jgi:hypothetical protein